MRTAPHDMPFGAAFDAAVVGSKRKAHPSEADAALPAAAGAPAAALTSIEDAMTAYFLEANTADELGLSLNSALDRHRPQLGMTTPSHAHSDRASADGGAPFACAPVLSAALDDFAMVAAGLGEALDAGSHTHSGSTSPNRSATTAASPALSAAALAAAIGLPPALGGAAAGVAAAATADELGLTSFDLWNVLDAFGAADTGTGALPAPTVAPLARGGATRKPPAKKVAAASAAAGAPAAAPRAASAARRKADATAGAAAPPSAPASAAALASAIAASPPAAVAARAALAGAADDGSDLGSDADGDGDGDGDEGTLDERKLKRMRRNRESAMRSRHRRKAYIEELEERVAELSAQLDQFRADRAALSGENARLREAAAAGGGGDGAGATPVAPVIELGVGATAVVADFSAALGAADCGLDSDALSGSRSHAETQARPQALAHVGSASFRPEAAGVPLGASLGASAPGTRSSKKGSAAVAALAGCMLVCCATILPSSGGGGAAHEARAGGGLPLSALWASVAGAPDVASARARATRRLLGLDDDKASDALAAANGSAQAAAAAGGGHALRPLALPFELSSLALPFELPPLASHLWEALQAKNEHAAPQQPQQQQQQAQQAQARAQREDASGAAGGLARTAADKALALKLEPTTTATPTTAAAAAAAALATSPSSSPRRGSAGVIRLPPNASWGDAERIERAEMAERQLVPAGAAGAHGGRGGAADRPEQQPILLDATLSSSMPQFGSAGASGGHVLCPKTYHVPISPRAGAKGGAPFAAGAGGDRASGGAPLGSPQLPAASGGGAVAALPSTLSLLLPWEALAAALPGTASSLLPAGALGAGGGAWAHSYAQVSCIVTNVTHFAPPAMREGTGWQTHAFGGGAPMADDVQPHSRGRRSPQQHSERVTRHLPKPPTTQAT